MKSCLVRRRATGIYYIMPWIIGFFIFQLYPLAASLVYSFTDFSIVGKPVFTGLRNFRYMFLEDRMFWQSLRCTFYYVGVSLPTKQVVALLIAMLLNQSFKRININAIRTLYFLPSIFAGSVSISVLWRFLFMSEGHINMLLQSIGLSGVEWIGNPRLAAPTLGLLEVWQFGSVMVIYLAGLKNIPSVMYEAAQIEGAGPVRTFRSVTLPMLSPVILFNLVMQTIAFLQTFTSAFIVTRGGPLKATYFYGMMIFENGFKFFKMGYACAQSWILFIIILAITLGLFRSSRHWVFYAGE